MAKPVVMVVDDEIDVANVITGVIKDSGKYEVLTAYSAQEALANLAKNKVFFGLGGNRIRFCFLDIKMPGMDGLQFLAKVRKDFGEDIGVSMLTAWEDEEKWDKATSGFVVNYIKKPFKSQEIISTLDNFFAGKDAKMVLDTFEKHIEKREEFKRPQS
ncbi:MAG: response regulator [Candidatus Margulisbacteria bacterium]|jgi:CheY-like chemotaxis protein|nr:response regulator [Candidatus Margulisiibacteriota bacterium]